MLLDSLAADIQKTCPKCWSSLPVSAFSKDKQKPDGLCGWCRSCRSAAKKARLADLGDVVRAQKRASRLRHRANDIHRSQRWHAVNKNNADFRAKKRAYLRRPDVRSRISDLARQSYHSKGKRWAQIQVAHAVRSCQLVPKSQCERCPSTQRIEAHHEDYSRPLDVQWLCKNCHVEADKARRQREAACSNE